MPKYVKGYYKHPALGFSTSFEQHRVCWNQEKDECCDCNPHDNCLLPEEDRQLKLFIEELEVLRLQEKDNK